MNRSRLNFKCSRKYQGFGRSKFPPAGSNSPSAQAKLVSLLELGKRLHPKLGRMMFVYQPKQPLRFICLSGPVYSALDRKLMENYDPSTQVVISYPSFGDLWVTGIFGANDRMAKLRVSFHQ